MVRAPRGGSIVFREEEFGVNPPLSRDVLRYNLGGIVALTLCYRGRTASSCSAAGEDVLSAPHLQTQSSNRDSAERWSAR